MMIGKVTYKNLLHDLIVKDAPVTIAALERLKEREANEEIFILDFKEVIPIEHND